MLRKILFAVFGLFLSVSAHAGQAINVEWVHDFIRQEHGLDIPYGPNLYSPKQVVNMDYVLKVVDIANAMLNGDGWTNYGESEYATREVADTVAGIYCIRYLIEHYHFTITTTPDTTSFKFDIAAAGAFHIDWGDGTRSHYENPNYYGKTISHTYDTAGSYTIRIGGYSRLYNPNGTISFSNNTQIQSIAGSLGKLFPTLKGANGPSQPCFIYTFSGCTNLRAIYDGLFDGIHGQPITNMFAYTFAACKSLTEIPENIFAKIKGNPVYGLFQYTFDGCTGLGGDIPAGLFAGIYGQPAEAMFMATFKDCNGLTGIGGALFGRIDGAPAYWMYNGVFQGCKGLQGKIPTGLFGKIKGTPETGMYAGSFNGCSGLTGAIPDGLFGYFDNKKPAPNMFYMTFYSCSGLGTNITTEDMPQYMRDGYALPPNLFAGIRGVSALGMFAYTFTGCKNLQGNIPDWFFGEIYGDAQQGMFASTFNGCSGLTGAIPPNLFGGENGLSGECGVNMFSYVFSGCAGLSGLIPDYLFGKLSGAPKDSMFLMAFADCAGLTGKIPATLFNKISGAPAFWMFNSTFSGCRGLTEIESGLFAKISGVPATGMFAGTFYGCSGLTGAIPENLFGNIYSTAEKQYADNMFLNTFTNCRNLGTGLTDENMPQYMRDGYAIPPNLFNGNPPDGASGLGGQPAKSMFASTFAGCNNLSGAIPSGLFGKIAGNPRDNMFDSTFSNCVKITQIPSDGNLFGGLNLVGDAATSMFAFTFSGCKELNGAIPEHLFGALDGNVAPSMFFVTFQQCAKLTGPIPRGLFGNMKGAPVLNMYRGTFSGCSALSGTIPDDLFGSIDTSAKLPVNSYVFYHMFNGCKNLTGSSGRINGQYLYEIWPDATQNQVGDMYSGAVNLSDYADIPAVWK